MKNDIIPVIVTVANINSDLFDIANLETQKNCEKYWINFDYGNLSKSLLYSKNKFNDKCNRTIIAQGIHAIGESSGIGYLSGNIDFKNNSYTTFRINNIFVSKEFRDAGVGKNLILHLEDILKAQNIGCISSSLSDDYDIFLKHCGFHNGDTNFDVIKHLENYY
jgi:GNAT superfamily N-acetyltransferase